MFPFIMANNMDKFQVLGSEKQSKEIDCIYIFFVVYSKFCCLKKCWSNSPRSLNSENMNMMMKGDSSFFTILLHYTLKTTLPVIQIPCWKNYSCLLAFIRINEMLCVSIYYQILQVLTAIFVPFPLTLELSLFITVASQRSIVLIFIQREAINL